MLPALSPQNLLSVITARIPQVEPMIITPPERWVSEPILNFLIHAMTMLALYQMHFLPVSLHSYSLGPPCTWAAVG